MPINLKKLTSQAVAQKPLSPMDIWNQLDRAVGKEYLRPIQERVLREWFEQREQRDNIIKMNTGTGKTLVGLLILQSSLHEGFGPALYICPDNYLVSQVAQQAKQFGVRCVQFNEAGGEPPHEFLNSDAILIINCKKLFNGKSTFGVYGDKRNPVPVGTILLDDAHSSIEQVRSQFSIYLTRGTPVYESLLQLFSASIRQQRSGTFAEIETGDYSAFLAVPFWSWYDAQAEIIQILSEHREDDELKFVWPLMKDILANCECVISGAGIQIVARVARTDLIPSFSNARRKIFLSATLLDDSQLARDLGVPAQSIRKQIKPDEFEDLSERLIVIPSDVDREFGTRFAMESCKPVRN
jgi:replicative superfamily II helicase